MGIFSPYALQAGVEGQDIATTLRRRALENAAAEQKMQDAAKQRQAQQVFGNVIARVLGQPQMRPIGVPQSPAPGQPSVPMAQPGQPRAPMSAPSSGAGQPMAAPATPSSPGMATPPVGGPPAQPAAGVAPAGVGADEEPELSWAKIFSAVRDIAPNADGETLAAIAGGFGPLMEQQTLRADRKAAAMREAELKLELALIRSEDNRLSAEQRAQAQRDANDIKLLIAQMNGQQKESLADKKAADALEKNRLKALPALQGAFQDLDSIKADVLKLKNHPGMAGAVGTIQSRLPTFRQDVADFEAQLNSLKSKIGFAGLSRMRQLSPTGGALGNVSNYESQQLQNAVTALDLKQGDASFPARLDEVINYVDQSKNNLSSAYETTYGMPAVIPTQAGTGGAVPAGTPQNAKRLPVPARFANEPDGTVVSNAEGEWRKENGEMVLVKPKAK